MDHFLALIQAELVKSASDKQSIDRTYHNITVLADIGSKVDVVAGFILAWGFSPS